MNADQQFQPGKAWRIALLLALFILINFLDKIVFGLVAVPMMAELDLSPTEFGLMAGGFFWLFAVGGIAGGLLADRFPTKWIIAGMAASWALLQFPLALTSSIAVILIGRVLLGMAEGPAWPVAVHSLYKWFPNSKRTLSASGHKSRTARGLLTTATLIVAALCYIALLLPDLTPTMRVILLGLGAGMAQAIYFTGPAMISECTPTRQRGFLLALDNSLASTAGILAPVVTGYLVQYSAGGLTRGYDMGFAVAGVLLLVAAAIGAKFLHPERSGPREATSLGAAGAIPTQN